MMSLTPHFTNHHCSSDKLQTLNWHFKMISDLPTEQDPPRDLPIGVYRVSTHVGPEKGTQSRRDVTQK